MSSRRTVTASVSSPGRTGEPPVHRGLARAFYLALAAFFFVLAVAGAFLPVLPTTPFLLVTSYLLLRSSPGLNRRLMASRRFGPLLEDWHVRGGVTRRTRRMALLASVAALGLSAWWSQPSPAGWALLVLIGVAGWIVVARLPLIDSEDSGSDSPGRTVNGI